MLSTTNKNVVLFAHFKTLYVILFKKHEKKVFKYCLGLRMSFECVRYCLADYLPFFLFISTIKF